MPEVPDWTDEAASDSIMDDDALELALEQAAADEPKFGFDVDLSDAGEVAPPSS